MPRGFLGLKEVGDAGFLRFLRGTAGGLTSRDLLPFGVVMPYYCVARVFNALGGESGLKPQVRRELECHPGSDGEVSGCGEGHQKLGVRDEAGCHLVPSEGNAHGTGSACWSGARKVSMTAASCLQWPGLDGGKTAGDWAAVTALTALNYTSDWATRASIFGNKRCGRIARESTGLRSQPFSLVLAKVK